jgi:hypothetical protein
MGVHHDIDSAGEQAAHVHAVVMQTGRERAKLVEQTIRPRAAKR